jgi:hypothetical protein
VIFERFVVSNFLFPLNVRQNFIYFVGNLNIRHQQTKIHVLFRRNQQKNSESELKPEEAAERDLARVEQTTDSFLN